MVLFYRIIVKKSLEERLEIINQDYGHLPKEEMIHATKLLQKRLGGARTKEATEAFASGDYLTAFRILLEYYDRSYTHSFYVQLIYYIENAHYI